MKPSLELFKVKLLQKYSTELFITQVESIFIILFL